MHFSGFTLAALTLFLGFAHAEEASNTDQSDVQHRGLNATQTLFEAVYPDPEKFNDKCTRAYQLITKILKNNETIVVDDYNALIQEQRNAGKVPEELDFNIQKLDSDKDGKVTRDELCSQIESALKSKNIGDLQELQINATTIAQVKPLVCTWEDKIPFMKDNVCRAVEEAEKNIDKQKEQQGESVNINKRQLSRGTIQLMSGISFFLGILMVLAAIGSFIAMFAAPVYIIALVINIALAVLFLKLGSNLAEDSGGPD